MGGFGFDPAHPSEDLQTVRKQQTRGRKQGFINTFSASIVNFNLRWLNPRTTNGKGNPTRGRQMTKPHKFTIGLVTIQIYFYLILNMQSPGYKVSGFLPDPAQVAEYNFLMAGMRKQQKPRGRKQGFRNTLTVSVWFKYWTGKALGVRRVDSVSTLPTPL